MKILTRFKPTGSLLGYGLLLLMAGCAASSDPLLRGLPRGMTIITADETYEVTGNSVQEIGASIRANGPTLHGRTVSGLATSWMQWEYGTVIELGECEMDWVLVDLNLTQTLPHWEPPAEAAPILSQYWDKYLADLREHEEGHRSISIEMSKEIARTLWGIRTRTCAAVNDKARREVADLMELLRERQQTYDRVYKPIYWSPKRTSSAQN